ncbi:multiple monosaccharide ABC transporter substrate-binding protein [Thermocaproicibacter melissae]|uniref:multiple monosaccharide ABC transporter substrate-binding protein n=1 Tax=Thermocaproicibacter melissae TaxID=2966552 RepID=UPI003A100904
MPKGIPHVLSKVLAALLACATILSLSACSKSTGGTSSANTESGTAGSGEMIGVSMPTQSLQRWNQDGSNMQKQLESKGYKVELQYANNDVNTQVQQIENMITKGCKVLVIAAIDGSSLTDVLSKAKDSGCKVIAYDRLIMKTPNVDYYATFDNYKVGAMQGQYLETKLGLKEGKGPFNIEIFAGDPGDNNSHYFYNGAMDVLNPYIKSGKLVVQSGQIDFAKVAITGWTSAKAQERMDNLITSKYTGGTKLDAVLSPNDSLAIGIIASLQSNGFGTSDKPYPIITGQDCDIANVKAIIAGQQSMSIFKDTRLLAEEVVSMVDAILQGSTPETNNTTDYNNGVKVVPTELLPPVYVDKSNYEDILIKGGYYTADQLK